GDDIDWHLDIRKSFFVPENKKVNDLLTEFQSTKTHMAIIVDEYGCMQGIVTLEDIIEEIVGDISDEQDDDDEQKDWYRQPDGSFIFEGKISLNDMCKVLDIDPGVLSKMRGDAETLAGLLLEKTGVIPKKKDVVEIGKYKFEILSADQRKINKVKLIVRGETKKQ
ncbi:MAG: transporter associated domain-containing protein, partial [Bacteroidales bacterium]|nr:transporter associated domain-containing protein [Bacteroidales bacterium]